MFIYSRQEEKVENKSIEGMSISWGIKKALDKDPDAKIVYHDGDYGKEPMIIIFGKNPEEILDKIKIIIGKYKYFLTNILNNNKFSLMHYESSNISRRSWN